MQTTNFGGYGYFGNILGDFNLVLSNGQGQVDSIIHICNGICSVCVENSGMMAEGATVLYWVNCIHWMGGNYFI